MTYSVTINVDGIPKSQGSNRAYKTAGGKVNIVPDNPRLMDWRSAVAEAMRAGCPTVRNDAVMVSAVFRMARTKVIGASNPPHVGKPDLDKLIRAVLDAGTGVAWQDDSRVHEISIRKRYATVGERPGVRLRLTWENE